MGIIGSRVVGGVGREGAVVGKLGADSRGRIEWRVFGRAVSGEQEDCWREGAVV